MSALPETIIMTQVDATAVVTINRPAKMNAITPKMAGEFFAIADEINDDPSIRVVIITGAGERSFCAGTDVKSLDLYPTPWDFRNRKDYAKAVWSIRKPVIAAINGMALGGGLELTLHSDIRIASANAFFGAGEVKLGWHAGDATFLLPRIIGYGEASKILLTGADLDAEEALRLKLVQELCAPDQLLARCHEVADKIARNAPIAIEVTKHLLRSGATTSFETAMKAQADLQAVCLATEDAREGIDAFANKRQPYFQGR